MSIWSKKGLESPVPPVEASGNALQTSRLCHIENLLFDKFSDQGYTSLPKPDESESGQMVLKQVKWALSSVYLSQTMWNPTKNSMKRLKRPTSVI